MTALQLPRRAPRGAEVALAFGAAAASFSLVAVTLAVVESDLLAAVFAVVCGAAVFAIARRWGVAYAVPAAMAGLLAYDWFQFPPTHPHEFPDSANLADLLVYLAAAVLVGELAAHAGRRAEVSELARSELWEEQTALRRVATLVARGVPPPEVFAAVAREVGRLLGVDATHIARYEPDDTTMSVGVWSRAGAHIPVGTRAPLAGSNVSSLVLQTGRPARINSFDDAPGPLAAMLREVGIHSSVGAPIVVERRLWGVIIASSKSDQSLAVDTESRIAAFTELIATAISNTEARTQVGRLADEQAALRRVATLVAQAVPASELFGVVAEEVGGLLGADLAGMARYETDDTATVVAAWAAEVEHPGAPLLVPGPWPLEGGDVATTIARTGRPVRMDDYHGVPGRAAAFVRDELGIGSSVGSPIIVEGRLWGALFVHSKQTEPLPAETELRLENFTELVATAMSNAEVRAEVQRLADEQAALRRVATLVARESSPAEVFAAVGEEVGRLLNVEDTRMMRYEDDGNATIVASWGERDHLVQVGTRLSLGGENVTSQVFRTGRPARMDNYTNATGWIEAYARELPERSAAGYPIVVGGRLWGAMIVISWQDEPLPPGTESRIGEFTELVATAISNVQARSDLAASRARIAAAADEERRRVVRDLHDGAQQRLVHTAITLNLARSALEERDEDAASGLVTDALEQAERATEELRELAHGILPGVLTHGGLRAGVQALASRMPVPVENAISVERLPPAVEATAYFVVAEALTNVAKHAHAEHAEVMARIEDGTLAVHVRDDGIGGARVDGSGLLGLGDRLAAVDGRLRIESPDDGGTLLAATIPLPR
ncbi:MAG: sensor kinase [Solirubrobacterales bacterium]|nr:sensor kinase [Solirubrobacterales bacterium]